MWLASNNCVSESIQACHWLSSWAIAGCTLVSPAKLCQAITCHTIWHQMMRWSEQELAQCDLAVTWTRKCVPRRAIVSTPPHNLSELVQLRLSQKHFCQLVTASPYQTSIIKTQVLKISAGARKTAQIWLNIYIFAGWKNNCEKSWRKYYDRWVEWVRSSWTILCEWNEF